MRRKSDRPEERSREVRHRNSHAGSQFLKAQSGIQMSVDIFFNAPQDSRWHSAFVGVLPNRSSRTGDRIEPWPSMSDRALINIKVGTEIRRGDEHAPRITISAP